MSSFEYASVLVSIVLALGIADILRFIGDTVREFDIRRVYWVHILWVCILLDAHVEFWLRLWDFKDLVDIGPELTLIFLGPALLFVTARTLLPASNNDDGMKEFFFRRKNPFFTFMIFLSLWSAAASPPESLIPSMLITLVAIIIFAACIFSSNRWLHQIVVGLFVAMEMLEMLDIF